MRPANAPVALILLFCFSLASTAWAKTYVLFTPRGGLAEDYDHTMDLVDRALKSRSSEPVILDMGNGLQFEVIRVLGHGNTTEVFEMADHRALRVPFRSGTLYGWTVKRYLADFYDAADELVDSEIPMPKIYLEESDPQRYIIVEKLKGVKFTLGGFLAAKQPREIGLTQAQYDQVMKELIAFAKKTWQFTEIGDFHSGQIVMTENGWVLDDFASGSERLSKRVKSVTTQAGKKTIFDELDDDAVEIPEDKIAILQKAALKARAPHLCSCLQSSIRAGGKKSPGALRKGRLAD